VPIGSEDALPTYEYACKACGEHLEVVQSFTDEPLTKCPNCKKKQLRKVFGSIGITFKGSGFYKTDSRSGSSSSPSTTPSETKTETTSTPSETKTETKADAKSDKKSDTKPSSTSAA
jgi:putative FmdB family regulatory protein